MTTYLFIDGGHLRTNYNNCVRQWFGIDGEINFHDLKVGLRGGGISIERCFYYDAIEDERRHGESEDDFQFRVENEEVLFNRIEELNGFFVRLGSLTGQRNRRQKKVDILLAVEALDHAVRRNMDRAILLTGDRDFEPLVHSLVQLGVGVQIVSEKDHTSKYLRRAADGYVPLSFDNYYKWTIPSLRDRFPIPVRHINMPPPRARVKEKGLLRGKDVVLQTCDAPPMFYVHANHFYRETSHLTLESNNEEKLKLYTDLQYGKVYWEPI